MSPTYWTASQIKQAARDHDWQFIKDIPPTGSWGMAKEILHRSDAGKRYDYIEGLRVMVHEDRRGGLRWVSITRRRPGDLDQVYLGPRYANKRDVVLSWLTEPIDWTQWGITP